MQEIIRRKNKIVQAGADRDITDEVREASEARLYVFCKAVMGMKDFVGHLHLPVCDWLQTTPPKRKKLLMPRETFKTSMCRSLGIHMVIQQPGTNPYFPGRWGKNIRILYAAETEKRALARLGWIKRQYEDNDILRALWPEVCWNNVNTQASTWTASHFSVPRTEDYPEATYEAAGVDSGSTGSHYDVTIKDDLIGLRSRQEPAFMGRAIEWFKTSHSLMNNQRTALDFVIGTRWAADDLYSWMDEVETTYDCKTLSIVKEDGSILFPERFTQENIASMKLKYGELFYLNYMNVAMGGGTTAVDMSKVNYCTLEGDEVVFEENQSTEKILEIIEAGNKEVVKTKPKRIWEMTAKERTEAFLDMQRRFYRDKQLQMEIV